MPGKQKRDKNEKNLTRLQSRIAGNVLKPHFDPKLGERQWDENAKQQLVDAVNKEFATQGHDAVYSQRKLEDWVSNGIYRWRKGQQKALNAPRPGGTVSAPIPASATFPPGPIAPRASAPASVTVPPAPVAPRASVATDPVTEAAFGRPPIRKRERILSNITVKPLQKQVRADIPSGELS